MVPEVLAAYFNEKARHQSPPDIGDGVVRFVIYNLIKPLAPSCSQLDHVDGLVHDQHDGFTLSLLYSLFSKGLLTIKSIPPKCRLGFSRVLKGALDKVICKPDDISCWVSLLVLPLCFLKIFFPMSNLECRSTNKRQRQEESITNDIRSWGVPRGSLQLMRETLAESASPMLDSDEKYLNLCERNLKRHKRKIYGDHYTAASAPSLPDTPIDHHHLIASQDVVLDRIKSFPRGTSCGHDGLRAHHLMDCLSGAVVAISDELVFSITQVVNLFLEGKYPMILGEYIASVPLTSLVKQFGVRVPGGGEAILHVVNHLVEDCRDDVGLLMLLADFQNAFNLVDRTVMLEEVRLRCPAISRWFEFCYSSPARLYYREHSLWSSQRVWYLNDGTIIEDTLVVDPRSRLEDVFPPNISRPLHESAAMQTMLLRHVGIVASGSTFDDALCVFNTAMKIDFLNNPSEIAALKLIKKMADIYFTRGGSHFRLDSCGSDFWVGTYYERDRAVSCAGIIGIKYRHNAVHDTLVDICFWSGISTGKEVDIGLGGGCDKALRPADMFLYS
nr:hypothetical protein [Tanacetum cinerariifolium]